MKILIVDDNITFLEKAKNFLLSHLSGNHELDVAENGKEALNYLSKNSVDIILLDISMPKMNGIEVAKVLQESYSEVKFIFITAYDDVKYLKQAIKLNAFDYLLKPLDTTELLQTMQKIIVRIKSERLINTERDKEKSLAIEHTLSQLIEKGSVIEELEDSLFNEYSKSDGIWLVKIESNIVSDIYGELIKYIEEKKWRIVNSLLGNYYIIIKCNSSGNGLSNIISNCRKLIEKLENEEILVDVYISEHVPNIMSINECKKQIEKMKRLKYFVHNKNIFTYLDINENIIMNQIDHYYNNIIDKFSIDVGEAFEAFKEYERAIITKHFFERKVVEKQCSLILEYLIDNPQMKYFEDISIDIVQVDGYEYFYQLTDFIKSLFSKYIKTKSLIDSNKPKILILFMEYIERNYGDNLDLLTISESLYVSKSYLNSIVRRNLGSTVMQYINDYRLKKACDFLSDTNMSIKDIAKLTGYSGSNYFIKVFRNKYSLTPNEYRQHVKGIT